MKIGCYWENALTSGFRACWEAAWRWAKASFMARSVSCLRNLDFSVQELSPFGCASEPGPETITFPNEDVCQFVSMMFWARIDLTAVRAASDEFSVPRVVPLGCIAEPNTPQHAAEPECFHRVSSYQRFPNDLDGHARPDRFAGVR